MAKHGSPEKARKYLSYLDDARCKGKWHEVSELARKVEKHAPGRKCLVLAAQAEAELVLQASKRPFASLRTALQDAVDNENGNYSPEDVYQARTYLASRCYNDGDKDAALATIPAEAPYISDEKGQGKTLLQQWTYVCVIKNAYIRDLCRGPQDEFESTHQRDLAALASVPESVETSPEYYTWAEKLITRLCISQSRQNEDREEVSDPATVEASLAPFRAWSKLWGNRLSESSTSIPSGLEGRKSRIWRDYYFFLSKLLCDGYVYPTSTTKGEGRNASRLVQSSELRHVEETYESLLMKEIQFPEASTINTEVEEWADQVMANWTITCGPSWQDDDLGRGGQEAASKKVLEILYRAATRTFHSTPILRHLLVVHASIAEFDLSAKALDSYLDIIIKGRSREEKSGQAEPGLDDDATMLQTIANGISMLCDFGRRREATRSQELARYLEDWLASHDQQQPYSPGATRPAMLDQDPEPSVAGSVIAQVHRAIAISKANWARFTLVATERADLQASAISHLRQSLICDLSDPEDPNTLYSLALILAETRDTEAAIATVKQALSSQSKAAGDLANAEPYMRTRKSRTAPKVSLIGCWHLLALLLSSRQDFETAQSSCDAALESFEPHYTLPGELGMKQLSYFEKQHVVEVKMTQIALYEINEGAEVAVNASGELLSLYASIFDAASKKTPGTAKSQVAERPITSYSPAKGFRESLLGRNKEVRSTTASDYSRRISADTTRPPTISVTDEDHLALAPGLTSLGRSPSHKLQKSSSRKSVRRSRAASPGRPSSGKTLATSAPPTPQKSNGVTSTVDEGKVATPPSTSPKRAGPAPSQVIPGSITAQLDSMSVSNPPLPLNGKGGTAAMEVENVAANRGQMSRKPPFGYLPPRLSTVQQERYALCLLGEIWIFIAGLYRRAGMFDDASGAIDEAFKLGSIVEINAAATRSSAQHFEESGWGGAKSIDEAWADAYAEKAKLCLAQSKVHDAMSNFEIALSYHADHPAATVGLSNLLLDVFEEIIPLLPDSTVTTKQQSLAVVHESSLPVLEKINPISQQDNGSGSGSSGGEEAFPTFDSVSNEADTPPRKKETEWHPDALDRLAARDRAYGLLSSLTKLGSSWDSSEAWFALARAYEDSGQVEKAKEVLWWVVELEDKQPVREWRCLGQGYSC